MSEPTTQQIVDAGRQLCSVALLVALADQLRRSEYKRLPLPFVWWHSDRQDWWLSTKAGSRAIGTFEQAVTALATIAPKRSSD